MVIVTSSHHLLFLGSLIAFYNQRLSSQLHRVLRLLRVPVIIIAFLRHQILDYDSHVTFYIHDDYERIIVIDCSNSNLQLQQRVHPLLQQYRRLLQQHDLSPRSNAFPSTVNNRLPAFQASTTEPG